MRNLIITIIVTFLGVANAANDDLKFVTESADMKSIFCKSQANKPQLDDICKAVVNEECPGEPTAACPSVVFKDRDNLIKRMSSPELRKKVYEATYEKFSTLKSNYEKKCGTRFTETKIVLTDFDTGLGDPEYDQVKNTVKIPNWMFFDSTSGGIDALLAEQLSYSCLYSQTNTDLLIKLDKNAKKHEIKKPDSDACNAALSIVEANLKSIETADQRNCRESAYANFGEHSCITKYDTVKKAYSNLLFMRDRTQVSHWSRLCSAGNKEQLAIKCYVKNPTSSFTTKICSSKAGSGSPSTGSSGGK